MNRLLVTKCPKCGATCLIGSDEDFLVYCAHCRTSFRITNEYEMSVEEYRKRIKTKEYFVSSGWEAFYTPPETTEPEKKVEE